MSFIKVILRSNYMQSIDHFLFYTHSLNPVSSIHVWCLNPYIVKIVGNFEHRLATFCLYTYIYIIKLVDFHLVLNCPILSRHALKNNLHLRAHCVFLKLSKTLHIRWQFLFILMKSCKWGRTTRFLDLFFAQIKVHQDQNVPACLVKKLSR